jgi:hypothetical protein
MKMFSDCSGPCEECIANFIGGCLAGHGDDDFQQITIDNAKDLLANPYLVHRREMILKKFPELKGGS